MLSIRNLRQGEQVLYVFRRHWIIYVFLIFHVLLGLLMVAALYVILSLGFWGHMCALLVLMSMTLSVCISWLNHELDFYVVTNFRVIGVDQVSFLDRKVSETGLENISQASSYTKGILANICNYGSVLIETAGNTRENGPMSMDFCPDAMEAARLINNSRMEYHSPLHHSPNEAHGDIPHITHS